ncbi:MAG: ABC transporter permease [Deltaproteobacteria bacterium]|nr:ABC transporter permease [Deltaproteobacteria bacterium]
MTKLFDILRVSSRQVVRQRRRYFGVILSIALGTAGLIAVSTMSRDVKKNLNQDLELLGGCTLIKAYFEEFLPDRHQSSRVQSFEDRTVEAVRGYPGVDLASLSGVKRGAAASVWRNRTEHYTLFGVDEYFWDVNSFYPAAGTLFGQGEVQGRQKVCVLGAELARRIFGEHDAVGSFISIDRDIFRVVGILGGLGVGDRTQFAFIPLTTALDRIAGMTRDRLYIRCATWDDVEGVADHMESLVSSHQSSDRLRVVFAKEQLKRVKRIVWWVEWFIYLSVLATLVLGGFGIWNGMMSAVQARTREIGLKKAMGAEDGDILAQFLTEALCLSLGSAVIGIGFGRTIMEVIGKLLSSPPQEDLFLRFMMVGLLFALILGIGAGFYPALRASRMEVVKAIRYE